MAEDSPYKDYVKTRNLPSSGIKHNDYLHFICKKMFAMVNPPKKGPDVDDLNLDSGAAGTTSTTNGSSMEIDANTGKVFTFAGYIFLHLWVQSLRTSICCIIALTYWWNQLLLTAAMLKRSLVDKVTGEHNKATWNRSIRRDSDDATDHNGSKLDRTSADVADLSVATLSECIQAAWIVQSRLAERGKKKAKVNDRKIAMHLKKVNGKQLMIREQKFLISATTPEDPNRQLHLLKLRKLQQDLASTFEDLSSVEGQIIEDEAADAANLNNVDVMIENTLTKTLDKKNNHLRINETRVSPMPPDLAGASNMYALMMNARQHHCMI